MAVESKVPTGAADIGLDTEFHRGLGLFDATMVVVGSMIGSGIFIVSADMARLIGSPGLAARRLAPHRRADRDGALSYGELAAMMPRAGGQYVYLREAFSPLWGFLYGWTLFLVIQTGTIAAVAVAFAKFLGVFWPEICRDQLPDRADSTSAPGYALSLSTAQLVGVALIVLLTRDQHARPQYGKCVQNLFHRRQDRCTARPDRARPSPWAGTRTRGARQLRHHFWTARPDRSRRRGLTAATAFGLFVALCVSQTGSLFSSDAWNNITFTAGEVREPRRTIPLALALGTGLVIVLYLLANVAYLVTLPLERHPERAGRPRRHGDAGSRLFRGETASFLMAAAIMVSTFGCNNGLILAGARAYYAMARDGLSSDPPASSTRPCAGVGSGSSRALGRVPGAAAHRQERPAVNTATSTATCSTTSSRPRCCFTC